MDTILVVDDEKNYLVVMAALLTEEGYEVLTAQSAEQALDMIGEKGDDIDLLLTDMKMPSMDGIQLLARVKETRPHLPVIMMTAFGTVEKAVEAMKLGASDYVTKPFKNEDLLRAAAKALEMGRLKRENLQLSEALQERYSFANIIGKSKPMLEIYRLIEKVADTKANVLISGESGTGKELIAKAIHYQSPRAGEPFVAVNCSALASTLLESELFGHEKGAFTDAKNARKGRFEMAHQGTLFLDEIAEMQTELQAKLLRVLQERTFERVGGNRAIEVDVRLVAATNRDLKQEIAAGRFREDLFYRLNVVHIEVPPLRERTEDIPLLLAHFLKTYGAEQGLDAIRVSGSALRRLFSYSWPGNVRELENTMERALILCSGSNVEAGDLPAEIAGQEETGIPAPGDGLYVPINTTLDLDSFVPPDAELNDVLETLEKKMIRRALDENEGVQAYAAEQLGLSKSAMQYKMKKYQGGGLDAIEGYDLNVDRFIPKETTLAEALEMVERGMLQRALKAADGVQTRAAAGLGIDKQGLQYKIKKYGLDE